MGNDFVIEMIKAEKLSKSYGEKKVLDRIDLTINKGEFICILGQSGCGKTTLLNILGGFIPKDTGELTYKGENIDKPMKDCVMVFQEFDQLFPWMTLRKNIEFAIKSSNTRVSKEELHKISSYYIDMVKLNGYSDYYPHHLSGGMKQRTAIARSLATSPEVLLMDEPFGSLDVQTKNELQETLLKIWDKTQSTIVFVTHDVRESLKLADRIIIIKESKIIENIRNDKTVNQGQVNYITSML